MNKKLIAAAVSAAVVAPVAAQADAEWYGRINNAIKIDDVKTDDADTDLTGITSRIGVRASSDLDNGMTAHGHFEFSATSDNEGPNGIGDTRVATVGLSGGWGRIDVGNQWSAYNNTFGTMVSPTYSLGYYLYSSVGGGLFRESNAIKYSNTFGPVTLKLDYRLNDGNEHGGAAEKAAGNGVGVGVSFNVTDNITIAVAMDSEDGYDEAASGSQAANRPESELTGVAINGTFGNFWVTLGLQSHTADAYAGADDDGNDEAQLDREVDTQFIWVGGNFSESTNWLVGVASANDSESDDSTAGADDSSQTTLGLYHNMGGGMRVYFESAAVDSDNNEWDGSRHLLGMRYDF